ncbi:mannose-1-phosphate guanylyltransferase [Sphingobacterium rhinopitheci]|uniref:mannose-1-phosphate guanylyltransferase n=1 Tax=Sphingobacterium rhinopitheci TaxID=2781960 RepID=UPI001F51C928|nr:sugar phosphate nucleotidyltransferase [Sphingobacterium rhinopitheci]MCI0920642.1 mannose-1-phosphate guanylyltransferase [Sphingobacterium rhinopitheci]
MSKVINVVLSGGVGSRLWPLSRKARPKQYIPLFEGKSLFELTVARNQNIVDKTIMVGSVKNVDLAKTFLPEANSETIVEATPRNTAAAIAFAALACDPDDILIVTPSDHLIEGEAEYQNTLKQAVELAKDDYLVTFGIKPNKPETGYGYIEYDGNDVLSFREKPNLETAKEFLKKGNFLWNSGIFCFKASVYLEELFRFEPKVYRASKEVSEDAINGILSEELSLKIPSKSIDYAVMERSERIKVLPSNFVWSDMGSYDSLYDYLKLKGHKVDVAGNMVIGTDKSVSFLGVKDTVLVHTDDAILVVQKDSAQDVKHLYEELDGINSELL